MPPIDHLERATAVIEDLFPYLSDPHRALEALQEALSTKDPIKHLEESIKAEGPPFRTDLTVIRDRLSRTGRKGPI
jgi:hypothetical protein